MILSELHFFSEALDVRTSVNVILPQRSRTERRQSANAKFRTLYLLHGYSDDHTAWQRWTSIERYVEGKNLAVVMPAAHNSFYTDMAHGMAYFTYLTRELPILLREILPLSAKREDTFVAGLSMGGYGAYKLALSRPETYAAAASLSGAVDICRDALQVHPEDPGNAAWIAKMKDIFGDLEKVPGSQNDLFALAEKVAKKPIKPRLFQYCGTEDFLYTGNIHFRDFVQKLPFDHTYIEGPGDHSWTYWDAVIQKVIAWMLPE
jgi:S-formylglutathione hydrolase FrmB